MGFQRVHALGQDIFALPHCTTDIFRRGSMAWIFGPTPQGNLARDFDSQSSELTRIVRRRASDLRAREAAGGNADFCWQWVRAR